jgi:gamma-glutamyltranspeptidase
MTLEDLAEHTSTPVEPISLQFKDRVVVHEVRMPHSQSTF